MIPVARIASPFTMAMQVLAQAVGIQQYGTIRHFVCSLSQNVTLLSKVRDMMKNN